MKRVTSFSSGSEESLERSAFDPDEEGSGMLLSKKKRALRVPIDGDMLTNEQILRRAVLELHQLPPSRAVRHLSKLWVANIDSSLVATTDFLHL
jgi:hypothetical protein